MGERTLEAIQKTGPPKCKSSNKPLLLQFFLFPNILPFYFQFVFLSRKRDCSKAPALSGVSVPRSWTSCPYKHTRTPFPAVDTGGHCHCLRPLPATWTPSQDLQAALPMGQALGPLGIQGQGEANMLHVLCSRLCHLSLTHGDLPHLHLNVTAGKAAPVRATSPTPCHLHLQTQQTQTEAPSQHP